jgi:arsenite-transporting ATPase
MDTELLIPRRGGEKRIFFAGKGGVGKTVVAAATALWTAGKGLKTLIISTDPASPLSTIYEQPIGPTMVPIKSVPNLYGVEINPKKTFEEYKERILTPVREVYGEDVMRMFTDQLDSPCTEEMAVFDKFIDYVEEKNYDIIVFDTAPTGHTIRLLNLPSQWSEYIKNTSIASGITTMGPIESLAESKKRYDEVVMIMSDTEKTTFAFVLLPEALPIYETERAVIDIEKWGIKTSLYIVNRVLPKEKCEKSSFFKKRWEMQQRYLATIKEKFGRSKILHLPLFQTEIKGLRMLEKVANTLYGGEGDEG